MTAHRRVAVVGGGTGDPDLLTLDAEAALAGAAVVVLAGEGLDRVAEIAGGAEVLRAAEPVTAARHAAARHRLGAGAVVVVVPGDPAALACGAGRLLDALDGEGAPWVAVPGVAPCFAAAAEAGAAPTSRVGAQWCVVSAPTSPGPLGLLGGPVLDPGGRR